MKEKKLAILIFIFGLLLIFTGVSYSFFTFNKEGVRNSELIAGDIYMHYNESNTLTLENAMPRDTYDVSEYFEFIIDGKNTTLDKDIWYEIVLAHGDDHPTRTERIRDNLLRFRLVEVIDNQENELVNDVSFNDLTNQRIWVDTINRNITEEITKTYRLYMWISNSTKICAGDITTNCEYYNNQSPNWNNVYASIKVNVNGDFNEKTLPYNYLAKKNNGFDKFWPTSIDNVKNNITEINFLDLSQGEINQRYQVATIKEDVTDTTKGGQVLAWLEEDELDNTKYIMYIASEGTTYFPSNCSDIFYDFTNLKFINFENIDTSNITNMSHMFSECSSLTSLDLSSFDTSQVTNMNSMFSDCSSLTSLDISNFNTSKVTGMGYMFDGCSSLTNLNLSNFDTSKVTNMNSMFSDCSSLISLDLSNFDTSRVTDMYRMFGYCSSLTSLDLSSFDTSRVTDMCSMFQYCSKLTILDLSNFDTSKVKNTSPLNGMHSMFYKCSSLTSLDVSNFDTSNVTNMSEMFFECSSLTSLDLSSFDTSNVKNISRMFYKCSNLTSLDLSNFNTSNVTDMNYMFRDCGKLTSLDLSSFNTSQVTNMSFMFCECYALTSLNLSNFNTSKVTDMSFMFCECYALTSLNLSNFNTSKVTDMYHMFRDCRNLISLDISNFDLSSSNATLTRFASIFSFVLATCQVLVKDLDAQNWILNLSSSYGIRPSAWTTSNVIIKS